MQLLKNDTPYDQMYMNNAAYGGTGYNPVPPQYSAYQQPYVNPYGYQQQPYGYNQPQQLPQYQQPYGYNQQQIPLPVPMYDNQPAYTGKTYEEQQRQNGGIQEEGVDVNVDLDNCMMGMSADNMMNRFAYQNDPRYINYNPYANNTNPFGNAYNSYYPTYTQQYQQNQYYNPNNPYAVHQEGYYNPYLSNSFMQNMQVDYNINKQNVNPFNMQATPQPIMGYGSFSAIAEQQKMMQQQWENQQKTYKMLCDLNNKFYGVEPDHENIERQNKIAEKRWKEQCELQQEAQLCGYINQLSMNLQNQQNYESPQRRRYIENWNRKYDEWSGKFPENYSMYQFFNEGIAENMYMETLIEDAKRRERDLNSLYDKAAFREQFALTHPDTYDAKNDIPLYMRQTRLPLTLDDMEVKLPESISNSEDFKRRERFMNSIINSMPI